MGRQEFWLPSTGPPPYASEAYCHRTSPRWWRVGAYLLLVLGMLSAWKSFLHFPSSTSQSNQDIFHHGVQRCAVLQRRHAIQRGSRRKNPRWNSVTGQQIQVLLRNATLFDGERFLEHGTDILFAEGVVKSISQTTDAVIEASDEIEVVDLEVDMSPLVDMHSHHLLLPFHSVPAIRDVNETPLLGPLTPFVRSIDGMKAYDPAIEVIAGGGVTTSLILPGSANIIGGEAYVVKNARLSGTNREPVVEELLLDHGIPDSDRQRYVKMACGEKPKHTYFHTRLGNVWLLREHFAEAQEVLRQQDSWCKAASLLERKRFSLASDVDAFMKDLGRLPESAKYDTTIAMLRGQANINIHCYEPEDFERMLAVLHEFGIRPSAFHHALEAWQVPELLEQQEPNITIATFAENAFFKAEAYGASLRAGKVLNDHGIPVAYKSDHTGEGNNAKYVFHQAAVAHAFGLPADKALQSVTSVPAKSLQQDHRVGFVRPGQDADLVVWDSHPLATGATAVQVYIDGNAILQPDVVAKTLERALLERKVGSADPKARRTVSAAEKQELCDATQFGSAKLVFTGIKRNLLPHSNASEASHDNDMTLVLQHGKIVCFATATNCISASEGGKVIALKNGYVLPGLTAVSSTLGLVEISGEPSTSDGYVDAKSQVRSGHIDYAKYGVQLEGRALGRARIGGITKAVVAPLSHGGLVKGMSVEFRTSGTRTVLDDGIVKEDVALHFELSEASKAGDSPTPSGTIGEFHEILTSGSEQPEGSILHRAATGDIPVVVHVVNTDLIRQLIWLKRDLPTLSLVIFGGHGAVHLAPVLRTHHIPVILTGFRGVPDTWSKRDALSGPPLTLSPAQILSDAGVLFALAINGDSHIHNLAAEAGWAAKYAGLSEREAVGLMAGNVEKILGLKKGKEEVGDFVVWEGNPLKGEGSVVLSVESDGTIGTCWPDDD
ncbi:putative metal-dependent hydrolase, composite domain superfamily [Septoria linicola]|nr:putative metal-dependent hydrolase, composite domain superfamily [Septoria linicola]